jgi:hypothetical protein
LKDNEAVPEYSSLERLLVSKEWVEADILVQRDIDFEEGFPGHLKILSPLDWVRVTL